MAHKTECMIGCVLGDRVIHTWHNCTRDVGSLNAMTFSLLVLSLNEEQDRLLDQSRRTLEALQAAQEAHSQAMTALRAQSLAMSTLVAERAKRTS